MKKERIIEILILIVLFCTILGGALFYVHTKIEKPNTYNIVFNDIDSIVKGSPVRFMGINIGHVIKLKRKDKYIICKIRVTKKGVKLPDGTRAKVAFNGLGGSKSIELLPPLTNDDSAKGIISDKALRINDFNAVFKSLKELCVTIDNIVQGIDTEKMSVSMEKYTNPEGITKIDEDMEKIINQKNKNDKNKILDFLKKIQ